MKVTTRSPAVQGTLLAIREEPRAILPTFYARFSWCSFFSLFLLSFLFFFFLTDPFLGNQRTFGLLSTLGIWFLSIPSYAFNKCQQISHGLYLNFSEAATVCPANESLEVNKVTIQTRTRMSSRYQWGILACTCVKSALDSIEKCILDVCNCTL